MMSDRTIGCFIRGMAAEYEEIVGLTDELAQALLVLCDQDNAVCSVGALNVAERYREVAERFGMRCESCGHPRLDVVYVGEVWLCRPCTKEA